jgi:hypothetical protein
VVAALVAAAGCGDGAGPEEDFDAEDAALVALTTDDLAGAMIFDVTFAAPSFSAESAEPRAFSRSRDCPAGGSVSIEGTVDRVRNGDGSVEWTLEASGEWDDCTRSRTRNETTITWSIDGTFNLEAHRKRNNGEPIGNQSTSKSGSFHWTRTVGDETTEGDCTFDVTSERNPDSKKIHITGTVCGREIDREIDWRQGT